MTTQSSPASVPVSDGSKSGTIAPLALAAPWRDASDAPPSFPECGGCFRRLGESEVYGSESQPPYGYCADCDTFTTWPATRRGARPEGWVADA